MNANLKKVLLTGTAIVAVGALAPAAHAADQALGAVGGNTALTAGAANTIVERGSPADTDTGEFNATGGVTFGGNAVKAIDLDSNSGTVYIFDGTDAGADNAAEDTATFDGDVSIVTGKTLTIILGDDEDSGTGAVSVGLDISDTTNTDIFVAGSTAATRGGNLIIKTAAPVATNIGTNTVTIDADMLLTTLTLTAGDALAGSVGAALTTTLGDEAGDDINVTGLVNTAGAGNTTKAGGANNTTVTGTLVVGSGGIDINGGAGGTTGAGGASKVTVTPAVATLTGNTTIDGGAAGSTSGAGGAAELELTGGLTGGTGNFTVTGGIGASGAGAGDGGAATLDSDAAFTTTGTVTFAGGNGGAGTTDAADGGAALGEFAASLSTAGLTLTGGNGGAAAANVGGAATVTVATTGTIGSSGITLTGGTGGAFAGAAVGGAASLTFTGAVTSTGNIAVTGGLGNDDNTADGGAASIIFNSSLTATDETITITGGAGDATSNGDGGNASAIFRGNVTASSIVLDNGASPSGTGGTATATFDTVTDATGDIVVSGAITVGANNEGIIIITDDTATTNDTVTFSNNIGTSAAKLASLTIGANAADGGFGVFNGDVHSVLINIGVADSDGDTTNGDFNGDVTGTTITLLGGDTAGESATATFAGDVTAAIDLDDGTAGDGTSTVTFDGTTDQTQTGAITTDDGEGSLVVSNTGGEVSFSAAIGAVGASLDSVSFATGSIVNIVNDIYTQQDAAGNVGIDLNGTLNIDASAVAVSVDEDTGDIDLDGTVGITGDNAVDFTAASDIFIDGTFDTELTAAATTALTATASDLSLGLVSDTTIAAGNQIVVTTGDDVFVSDATDATVTLNIRKTAAFDPDATSVLVAAGGVTGSVQVDTSGTSAALVVGIDADTEEFDDGDSITVIDSSDLEDEGGNDTTWATLIASGDVELDDSAFVTFTDASVTDDLMVTVSFNDAADVLESGSSGVGAADALLAMDSADTEDELEEARGNLMGAATDEDAQEIAESLAPDVAGGAAVSGQVFASATGAITDSRLASLRTGSESGVAAGNMGTGATWWVQGFGTVGTQDDRDSIDGYDVDSIGIAVGADTENLSDNAVVGLALSYANTNVDSDNSNSTETDVDSFQIALYGDYDIDERTYVAGQVGYIWSNIDTTRHDVGGIAGLTANGDTDANQFNVRGEVGRDYMAGNDAKLTPKVLADYTYFSEDSYTETGAGTANLEVDPDAQHAFNIGLGADAKWMIKHSDGSSCEPALHAAVRYDLIGDDVETTNTYTGGGAAFQADGFDSQRTTVDLGADLTYHATTNWDLKAGYNFEWKQDFTSHSGVVKAAYKF